MDLVKQQWTSAHVHLQEVQSGSRLRLSSRYQCHPREEGQERRAPAFTACLQIQTTMDAEYLPDMALLLMFKSIAPHRPRPAPARFCADMDLLPKLYAWQGTKALRAIHPCMCGSLLSCWWRLQGTQKLKLGRNPFSGGDAGKGGGTKAVGTSFLRSARKDPNTVRPLCLALFFFASGPANLHIASWPESVLLSLLMNLSYQQPGAVHHMALLK